MASFCSCSFQQNPACHRRHWRSLLAEQLPQLQAIDGKAVSLEEVPKKPPIAPTEGGPRAPETWEPLTKTPNDEAGSAGALLQQHQLLQHQLLLQQHLQLCHPIRPPRARTLLQTKHDGLPCGAPPKQRQTATVTELGSLNLGVVGVGAPGTTLAATLGSFVSRRDPPVEFSGKQLPVTALARIGSAGLVRIRLLFLMTSELPLLQTRACRQHVLQVCI